MSNQDLSLYEQLRRESAAMAKYAFSSGLKIPAPVVQRIERVVEDQPIAATTAPAASDTNADSSTTNSKSLADLAVVHEALATIVAPAMPRTILLLDDESKKTDRLSLLGPVPLVRQMMVAAIISLVALILITLSSQINSENLHAGLTGLNGLPLLMVEMLYVAAAAMGASFAALFTANRYIVAGTFDPKYRASYWVRFILGIMAGVILADFVPVDATSQTNIHKPLLAILGGFSASLVYRILSRLVDAVESIFRGDPRDQIAANEQAVKVQADAKVAQVHATVAKRLMSLHRDLGPDADPSKVADRIDQVVNELVPTDLALGTTTETAAPVQAVASQPAVAKSKPKSKS